MATFVVGAVFVMTDIGLDFTLLLNYIHQNREFEEHMKYSLRRYGNHTVEMSPKISDHVGYYSRV